MLCGKMASERPAVNNEAYHPGLKMAQSSLQGSNPKAETDHGARPRLTGVIPCPAAPSTITRIPSVGLKEAKDAVEAIQRGERPQDLTESDNSLQQTLVSLLKQGRKNGFALR
jgi:hypothetical protein